MAIRKIVTEEDEILKKKSREVTNFDDRLHVLLDDMQDTLIQADGVGLAAPQVGVLKRIFILNIEDNIIEFINPMIIEKSGSQEQSEGCLSCPGRWGTTIRPKKVKIKYQDRNGELFTIEGEDLFAQAVCHEYDHLDGILFIEKVVKWLEK